MYGELFVYCLSQHNMLCWGVYRFRDSQHGTHKVHAPSSKRYVICNPSADFRLMPTDLVYVLQQFKPKNEPEHLKKEASDFNLPTRVKNDASQRSGSQRSKASRRSASSRKKNASIKKSESLEHSDSESRDDQSNTLSNQYQDNFHKSFQNIQMLSYFKKS